MTSYYGEIMIPELNRGVTAYCRGYWETDTNAFIGDDEGIEAFWLDTGEEVTDQEFEIEIKYLGRTMFLHEFIDECTMWKIND